MAAQPTAHYLQDYPTPTWIGEPVECYLQNNSVSSPLGRERPGREYDAVYQTMMGARICYRRMAPSMILIRDLHHYPLLLFCSIIGYAHVTILCLQNSVNITALRTRSSDVLVSHPLTNISLHSSLALALSFLVVYLALSIEVCGVYILNDTTHY